MDKFWDDNATVLVVSHSMDFIQQSCNKAVWLSKGKVKFVGEANEAVSYYLNSV
jgi:ABC-2 type transport system ATP-binding protein/lipopolysaccharide transport system ATP-binding protein